MDRRQFISGIAGNVLATPLVAWGEVPPAKAGSNVSDLAVTLDFGGGTVATFAGATAVDRGDFVGEFVRQKCFLCTNAAFPDWRLWFRYDADGNGVRIKAPNAGWRDEVVVEYGRSHSGTVTHLLTPYKATITKDGVQVYQATVPTHFWYSRWRYQSSVRPVVRGAATLKARKWIPNYGPNGLFGLTARTTTTTWPGPMGAPSKANGGFNTGMAAAGDNDDLGYLTEFGADYIQFGSAGSLTSVLTEGEWCGNWMSKIRDDVTHGPLQITSNSINYKGNGGSINLASQPSGAQRVTYPNWVAMEPPHMYVCATLPWLLTDDPFFLEELQFIVTWVLLYNGFHRGVQNLPKLSAYPGETRGMSWGLRDTFQLATSTPASVPSWLLPKSYWQACLDDCKTYAMKYVNSPAYIHSVLRTWTRTDANATWEQAWTTTVVGQGILMGHTDWQPVFDWAVDAHIKQTNGTSGWPRGWPVPYYSVGDRAMITGGPLPTTLVSDTSRNATMISSWADLWAFYKAGSPEPAIVSTGLTQSGGIATFLSGVNTHWRGGDRIVITGANDSRYNLDLHYASPDVADAYGNRGITSMIGNNAFTYKVDPATPATATTGTQIIARRLRSDVSPLSSKSPINDAGWDSTTIYQATLKIPSGISYFLHLRSALAVAVTIGTPGAQACYDYLQGRMPIDVLPSYPGLKGQARFSVDPIKA